MSNILNIFSFSLLFMTIRCIYIETNFYLYLNQICLTKRNNLILTELRNDSLIRLYFNQIKCNSFLYNSNDLENVFIDNLRYLKQKDLNLFIELNNEKDIFFILNKIRINFQLEEMNVIIVLRSKSI